MLWIQPLTYPLTLLFQPPTVLVIIYGGQEQYLPDDKSASSSVFLVRPNRWLAMSEILEISNTAKSETQFRKQTKKLGTDKVSKSQEYFPILQHIQHHNYHHNSLCSSHDWGQFELLSFFIIVILLLIIIIIVVIMIIMTMLIRAIVRNKVDLDPRRREWADPPDGSDFPPDANIIIVMRIKTSSSWWG